MRRAALLGAAAPADRRDRRRRRPPTRSRPRPRRPAPQPQFSMDEIEREIMCPTCETPLYLSHSPAANRIRAYVAEKRDAGLDEAAGQGPPGAGLRPGDPRRARQVRASGSRPGSCRCWSCWSAWRSPSAWRVVWRRRTSRRRPGRRSSAPRSRCSPGARRAGRRRPRATTTADERVGGEVALAFAAGLLSFATPCVLPLVPGYLSVVSGIEADALQRGGRTAARAGAWRRRCRSSSASRSSSRWPARRRARSAARPTRGGRC